MITDSLIVEFNEVDSGEIDKIYVPEYKNDVYQFKYPYSDTIINPGGTFIAKTGILCTIIRPYYLIIFPPQQHFKFAIFEDNRFNTGVPGETETYHDWYAQYFR